VQRIPYAERLISAIVPQPGPGDTILPVPFRCALGGCGKDTGSSTGRERGYGPVRRIPGPVEPPAHPQMHPPPQQSEQRRWT